MSEQRERVTHILGAGGVGFYCVIGLAATAVRPLRVYDDDNLSGGLGHARLPVATPTTRKVDLLRGMLRVNFGRGEGITFVAEKFTGSECVAGDLVVDCSDMGLEARTPLHAAVKAAGARYIRVSYDGRLSIVVVAEGLPLSDRPGGGYANVPSLALSMAAGGIGAEVIANLPDSYVDFQLTLGELWTPSVRAVA